MTIMFQLFSAKDLQMLTLRELEQLKDIAILAIQDETKGWKLQEFQKKAEELAENRRKQVESPTNEGLTLKRTMNINPPADASSQINEMLNKRLTDVAQQLRESRKASPYDEKSFEKAKGPQKATDMLDEKEERILAWAMSCEINFIEFYTPLRRARDVAYEYFLEKTGQRPEGPDSQYSPFNREHPLRSSSSSPYDT